MTSLRPGPVDLSALLSAAGRVVTSALWLEPGHRLVVCGDATSRRVGGALIAAGREAGVDTAVVDLDRAGERPLDRVPPALREALIGAHASAFVASASPEEIGMRQELLALAGDLGLRHAHMPAITDVAFARGMQVDFRELARRGHVALERLRGAKALQCASAAGTELTVSIEPDAQWYAQLGELTPGRWGNLPAGALYVTPTRIDGVLVVDASIGDIAGLRWGVLQRRPIRLTVEDSRVISVDGAQELARAVLETMARDDNGNRIGLVAVGVNTGIGEPTGEVLVDQNRPGVHVAIGDPAARAAGATFSARTSFAACQALSTVRVRGTVLIEEGVLVAG